MSARAVSAPATGLANDRDRFAPVHPQVDVVHERAADVSTGVLDPQPAYLEEGIRRAHVSGLFCR